MPLNFCIKKLNFEFQNYYPFSLIDRVINNALNKLRQPVLDENLEGASSIDLSVQLSCFYIQIL